MTMVGGTESKPLAGPRSSPARLLFFVALLLAPLSASAHARSPEIPGLLKAEEIERALAAAERLAQSEGAGDEAPPVAALAPLAPATRLVDWLIEVAALDSRRNLLRFRESLTDLGYPQGDEAYLAWLEHMERLLLAFDAARRLAEGFDLSAAETELMAMPTALEQGEAQVLAARYVYEMRLAGVAHEDGVAITPFAKRIATLLAAAQRGGP